MMFKGPTICIIVLLIVGHKVVECETIMRDYKIDPMIRSPAVSCTSLSPGPAAAVAKGREQTVG